MTTGSGNCMEASGRAIPKGAPRFGVANEAFHEKRRCSVRIRIKTYYHFLNRSLSFKDACQSCSRVLGGVERTLQRGMVRVLRECGQENVD